MSEADDPYLAPYSQADLTAAAGLPPRTMELLIRENVAPAEIGRGVRDARLYSDLAVQVMGVVGAIYHVALDPVPAARIARAIADDLTSRGYLPDGLEEIASLGAGTLEWLPPIDPLLDRIDRYQLHRALITARAEYRPDSQIRSDWRAEIIDRSYLYAGPTALRTRSPWSGRRIELPGVARIIDWRRGGEIMVRSIEDDIPPGWADGDEAALAAAREVEAEFERARRDATARIIIDISRAVRVGYFRLDAHRAARAARRNVAMVGQTV